MKHLFEKVKNMNKKELIAGCGIVAITLVVTICLIFILSGRQSDKDNIIADAEKTKNVETTIKLMEETTSTKKKEITISKDTIVQEETTKKAEITTTGKEEESTQAQNVQTNQQQQTTKKEVPTQKYEQQTTKAPKPTTQKTLSPLEKIAKDDPDWSRKGFSPEYKKKLESYGVYVCLDTHNSGICECKHDKAYDIPNDIVAYCDTVVKKMLHLEITPQQCYDTLYNYLYNYNSEPDMAWCEVCQGYHDTQHTIPLTNGCVYDAAKYLVVYYYEGNISKQIGKGVDEGYGYRYMMGTDWVVNEGGAGAGNWYWIGYSLKNVAF